jgi:hypothetical protein
VPELPSENFSAGLQWRGLPASAVSGVPKQLGAAAGQVAVGVVEIVAAVSAVPSAALVAAAVGPGELAQLAEPVAELVAAAVVVPSAALVAAVAGLAALARLAEPVAEIGCLASIFRTALHSREMHRTVRQRLLALHKRCRSTATILSWRSCSPQRGRLGTPDSCSNAPAQAQLQVCCRTTS